MDADFKSGINANAKSNLRYLGPSDAIELAIAVQQVPGKSTDTEALMAEAEQINAECEALKQGNLAHVAKADAQHNMIEQLKLQNAKLVNEVVALKAQIGK